MGGVYCTSHKSWPFLHHYCVAQPSVGIVKLTWFYAVLQVPHIICMFTMQYYFPETCVTLALS